MPPYRFEPESPQASKNNKKKGTRLGALYWIQLNPYLPFFFMPPDFLIFFGAFMPPALLFLSGLATAGGVGAGFWILTGAALAGAAFTGSGFGSSFLPQPMKQKLTAKQMTVKMMIAFFIVSSKIHWNNWRFEFDRPFLNNHSLALHCYKAPPNLFQFAFSPLTAQAEKNLSKSQSPILTEYQCELYK
jgi:hypothetical protein